MTTATFGKYAVIEEIGRGGMGIVYKATDTVLGRIVALKELVVGGTLTGPAKDESIARFKREAQTAARLSHPNIVTIFDVGEEEGRHYIAMEYLEGISLKTLLEKGAKLSLDQLFQITRQICEALDHAHLQGVVHRDVKPDNILLMPNGQIKLTDFGIARLNDNQVASMTQTGTMLGTLAYISPEQLQNSKTVDGRADIFSLGVVLYELYTGVLPFDGGSVGGTILKIITEEPLPPRERNPHVPAEIEGAIIRCLRKNPDDRFSRTSEIVASLPAVTPPRAKGGACRDCGAAVGPDARFCPSCGTPQSQTGPLTLPAEPAVAIPAETRDPFTFLRAIGKPGSGKGEFFSPRGLAISKGLLTVADTQNARLQVFDRLGNWQEMLDLTPFGSRSPCGVHVDTKGRQWVIDSLDGLIRVFDSFGQLVATYGAKGDGRGQFKTPGAIAGNGHDHIVVSDPENYRVQILDATGQVLRIFGRYGTGPGEFRSPYGVAIDDQDHLFVLDYGIPQVQVLDRDGISRLHFGQRGSDDGQFSIPRGIAIDPAGHVFVADTLNHRLQVFSPEGVHMVSFGAKGGGKGEFMGPEALAFAEGELFVLDKGNNRVQVFACEL